MHSMDKAEEEGFVCITTPEVPALLFTHLFFGHACSNSFEKSDTTVDTGIAGLVVLLCTVYNLICDWFEMQNK